MGEFGLFYIFVQMMGNFEGTGFSGWTDYCTDDFSRQVAGTRRRLKSSVRRLRDFVVENTLSTTLSGCALFARDVQ